MEIDKFKEIVDLCFETSQKNVCKTILVFKELISLEDIRPMDLLDTLKEFNITENHFFSINENEEPCIMYSERIPDTEEYINARSEKLFHRLLWPKIYEYLIGIGYKRTSSDYTKLREYDIISLYSNQDYDKILEYYLLRFKK